MRQQLSLAIACVLGDLSSVWDHAVPGDLERSGSPERSDLERCSRRSSPTVRRLASAKFRELRGRRHCLERTSAVHDNGDGHEAYQFGEAFPQLMLVAMLMYEAAQGTHHFEQRWSRMSTAVRLADGGPYGTQMDREQVAGGHRLLITLGRTRVDSRGRRWSFDSPNTLLNGPMMDASAST